MKANFPCQTETFISPFQVVVVHRGMHPQQQLQALMLQRHAQLRAEAEEVGDAHRELRRWEEEMAQRDEAIRQRHRERLVREQDQQTQQRGQQQGEAGQAEALRAQGNEHYRRGRFEQAVDCYTRCLVLDRCGAFRSIQTYP